MKNIIFILATEYNHRDHQRFGIDRLRSRGYRVQLWETGDLLLTNRRGLKQPPDFCADDDLMTFSSKDHLIVQLLNIPSDSIVIPICPCTHETFKLYKILNQRKIRYVDMKLASIPLPRPRLIERFHNINISVLHKLLSKVVHRYFYKPKICLRSSKEIRTKTKHIIDAHNLDYDIYLSRKNLPPNPLIKKNYAVFIDTGEADYYHQDIKILGIKKFISSQNYFPSVCSYFDYIEKKYGLDVIIAGHPRVRYKDKVYGNRPIIYAQTPQLIRQADLVLMHYSTSINFVVLYKKPVVFIKFNKHYRACANKRWPDAMAHSIASSNKVIMGESASYKLPKDNVFRVNEEKYQNYRDRYIKAIDSPKKNTWDIFSDAISS